MATYSNININQYENRHQSMLCMNNCSNCDGIWKMFAWNSALVPTVSSRFGSDSNVCIMSLQNTFNYVCVVKFYTTLFTIDSL
jgi:hypothetical protein